MTFVEITSLIGALGGLSATALGLMVYLRQRKTDMRRQPIFEISAVVPVRAAPDITEVFITVRNTEVADYRVERVEARQAIFIENQDMPSKFDASGEPVDWPGLQGIILHKSMEMPSRHQRNGDHYSIPLSSRSKRITVSFIWRWKDEDRLRKMKKKVIMPASNTH